MGFKFEEVKAKVERIKDLEELGFNTPRFFFIPQGSIKSIPGFEKWANGIGRNRLDIFNIRTYGRSKTIEETKTPHITDVPADQIVKEVKKVIDKYYLMVDSEIPDDGRFAGNVILFRDERGRPKEFTIEWCKKEIRAMVRETDQSLYNRPITEAPGLHPILRSVINKARRFYRKNPTILEWTWFCERAGVKRENLVWWEYRKYGASVE